MGLEEKRESTQPEASKAVRIRQVQPHETEHLNLLDELRNLTRSRAPEKVKVTAFLEVYKNKWWTCDRMRQYFQIITDDSSRAEFLDGETKSFKRCMDADSGNLNKLIGQIQSNELRIQIQNRIAEWENTSDARGAVEGIVKIEEVPDNSVVDVSSDDSNSSERGNDQIGEQESSDSKTGGDGAAQNSLSNKNSILNVLKEGRLKIRVRGFLRGKRWVQDTFRLEDHRPEGFTISGKSKLPQLFLNHYDLELHDERNESTHYYYFRLIWNGDGSPPERRVLDIGCKSQSDRDEWVKQICQLTEKEAKQPKLQTVPDGSGKLFKSGQVLITMGFMGGTVAQDCLLSCWNVEELCCADGVSFSPLDLMGEFLRKSRFSVTVNLLACF